MVEGLRARPDASADLVLAADAMVYVADLAPLLREVARVLTAGGVLAFTVETHGGDGVILGEGLRYAHAAGYVRASIEAAGLSFPGSSIRRRATRTMCRFPGWSRWRQNRDEFGPCSVEMTRLLSSRPGRPARLNLRW